MVGERVVMMVERMASLMEHLMAVTLAVTSGIWKDEKTVVSWAADSDSGTAVASAEPMAAKKAAMTASTQAGH